MGKDRRFNYGLFNLLVICWSVVFSDLLDNLIRAGRSQAAKRTADGRQPFVGQRGLFDSRCGKVADDGDAGNRRDDKRGKIHEFFLLCICRVNFPIQRNFVFRGKVDLAKQIAWCWHSV